MAQDGCQRLKRRFCLPAGEGLKLMRTRIAKLDHGKKRYPPTGARWQGVRLNMMARQPANGMAKQSLKDRNHARLKTDKADEQHKDGAQRIEVEPQPKALAVSPLIRTSPAVIIDSTSTAATETRLRPANTL